MIDNDLSISYFKGTHLITFLRIIFYSILCNYYCFPDAMTVPCTNSDEKSEEEFTTITDDENEGSLAADAGKIHCENSNQFII